MTIDQKVPVDEVMFMHRHTVKEKGMVRVTVKSITMILIGVLLRLIRPNVVMVEIRSIQLQKIGRLGMSLIIRHRILRLTIRLSGLYLMIMKMLWLLIMPCKCFLDSRPPPGR